MFLNTLSEVSQQTWQAVHSQQSSSSYGSLIIQNKHHKYLKELPTGMKNFHTCMFFNGTQDNEITEWEIFELLMNTSNTRLISKWVVSLIQGVTMACITSPADMMELVSSNWNNRPNLNHYLY